MRNKKIFQYAIMWHPTDKQVKDEDLQSKFIKEPQTIIAKDADSVRMAAVMAIPKKYAEELDQIDVVVRNF